MSAIEIYNMEFPALLSEKITIQGEEYTYIEKEDYLIVENADGEEISFLYYASPRCPDHIEDYLRGGIKKKPANFNKINRFPQYKLCELATKPKYRKRGLATFLLNKMIEKYGDFNIFCYAVHDNLKYLKKFYRRFDFVGTRDDEQLIYRLATNREKISGPKNTKMKAEK